MAAIQREIQFYTTEKLDTYFNGRFATFHRIEEVLKEEKSTEIGIPLDAKIFDEQFERDLKKLRNDAQYLFQLNKFYSNTILFPILVRNDLSESQQIYLWLRQLYDLMRISADNNLELPEAINSDNKKFNALYQYNITKYKKMLAENFAGQDNKEFKARQFMTDEMRRFVASMPKWTQLTEEKERCKKIIDKYCKSGSGISL